MEPIKDDWYLEPPDDPEWCEDHDCSRPCAACKYEERD